MTVQKGDDTTRTPAPNDAEAPEQTERSETPAEGERNDDANVEYHKRQALEHKTKAEQLNALFEKHGVSSIEALNEKLAQSPAARVEDREPDEDDADADDEALERGVDKWVNDGDAVARYAKEKIARLERRLDRLTRGVGDAFVARDVPDQAMRSRAIAHYRQNKHRLGDLKAAIAEVKAADADNRIATLTAELAQLRKKPDPDVVNAPRTHGREITAHEKGERKRMRESDFDAEIARLDSEGRFRDKMALQGKLRRDEIELEYGK